MLDFKGELPGVLCASRFHIKGITQHEMADVSSGLVSMCPVEMPMIGERWLTLAQRSCPAGALKGVGTCYLVLL